MSARVAATGEDYDGRPDGCASTVACGSGGSVASRRARAVISGDTLVDFGQGLEISERWRRDAHRSLVTRAHRPRSSRPELLAPEVRRPLEPVGSCEAEVGAKRVAHRVDEPVGPARREPVLPPEVDDLDAGLGRVDARLDPADEAVPEEDRQHVPAPPPLVRRDEELPDVVEAEELAEQARGPTRARRTAAGAPRTALAAKAPPGARPPLGGRSACRSRPPPGRERARPFRRAPRGARSDPGSPESAGPASPSRCR